MDRSAEAPLIGRQDDAHAHAERDDDDDVADYDDERRQSLDDPATVRELHEGGVGIFMWLLVLSAGISGLLFGYDTGVISATLVSTGTSLSGRELTSFDKSIITSVTSLFAFIASPLSSLLADAFGRKRVILLADVLFILGAIAQAGSYTVSSMVLGRAVVGAGVGAASFVTPMYIAELAPAAHRGRLVTMNNVAVTFGQAVAYIIGWIFTEHGDPATGWRWMVGLGALPAAVQGLLVLFMSETPRWLVKVGRSAAARRVIRRTLGRTSGSAVEDRILADIENEVREEEQTLLGRDNGGKEQPSWLLAWRTLLTVPKHRRALTLACMLQALAQLCGFNSLMYFSATIFTMLGFSVPTLTSLTVATTNFIFTIGALLLIDRVGRRRILLYSIPFMIVGLVLVGLGFKAIHLPSASGRSDPAGASEAASSSNVAATVILASMMLYVSSFAIGLGSVPWMQSELFPLCVRSLGSGLATATNWSANFVAGISFLPMMDALTPTWTFAVYAVVCFVGWVAIWMIYPETSGLTLEEATSLLEHGWGVKR